MRLSSSRHTDDNLILEQKLQLGEFAEHIKVERNKRAKRLALRLDTKDRKIRLVVPARASIRKTQEFLDLSADWIYHTLSQIPQGVPFENGQIIPLIGVDTALKISLDKTLKRTSIILKEKELIVSTNKDNPSTRIERYLKKMAKDYISELAHIKAAHVKKSIHSISIRDTKSRWGSCSTDGRLSFSWRLIFAPPYAFDYVVAHEVAHLIHMDHSANFWNACESLCDDYKKGKSWMRKHGHSLMKYGHEDTKPYEQIKSLKHLEE